MVDGLGVVGVYKNLEELSGQGWGFVGPVVRLCVAVDNSPGYFHEPLCLCAAGAVSVLKGFLWFSFSSAVVELWFSYGSALSGLCCSVSALVLLRFSLMLHDFLV